jgi:protein-tyrosine phosphatase
LFQIAGTVKIRRRRASSRENLQGLHQLDSNQFEAVLWIKGTLPVALAIVLCPRGDVWLKDELREVKKSGVDTLVSLLEPDEAKWLGLGDEANAAKEVGIDFLSYPIRDVHIPSDVKSFRAFVSEVADRLRKGEKIGMHCRGSIGRAPTTAACTLIQLGWNAKDAIAAIRAARGYPIPDTEGQLRWILNYKAES